MCTPPRWTLSTQGWAADDLKTSNHGTRFHFHATATIEIYMDSIKSKLGDDPKKGELHMVTSILYMHSWPEASPAEKSGIVSFCILLY